MEMFNFEIHFKVNDINRLRIVIMLIVNRPMREERMKKYENI